LAADIEAMSNYWWIDEATRLVQVTCRGVNPNNDQRFLAVYSLEIAASGLVFPKPAQFSVEILHRTAGLSG